MDSKMNYEIKTVQDMIDCTNSKNIDAFLVDLKTILTTAHLIQSVSESVTKKKKISKIKTDGFTWIDDGKHNATITLEANKSKT